MYKQEGKLFPACFLLFCFVLWSSSHRIQKFIKRKLRGSWWCVIVYPSVGNICVRKELSIPFHQSSEWLHELTNRTLDYYYFNLFSFHLCIPPPVIDGTLLSLLWEVWLTKWILNEISTEYSQSDSVTVQWHFC